MKTEHTSWTGAVRRAALFLGILGATVSVAACGDGADAPVPGPGGPSSPEGRPILRVALEAEIDVLNPLISRRPVELQLALLEGLVTVGEDDTWIPALAREIPTRENGGVVFNQDGTVDMTWRLRNGVTWHDGQPFTARDVCFTWRFIADPDSGARNREHYLGILDCEAVDDTTVVLHWDGPYGYYAGLFSTVLPAHVFGDMTAAEVANHTPFNRGEGFVGNGAFRFAEWTRGESLRVVRNEDYWRGPEFPAIDEIVFSFLPGPNGRLAAMMEGRFHWARVLTTQESEAAGAQGYRIHHPHSQTVTQLELNVTSEDGVRVFSDPRVRVAIFEAVNRNEIANQLLGGTVTPAASPLPPSHPFHTPDVQPWGFDPFVSEMKFDATDWIGDYDGMRWQDGQRMTMDLPIPDRAPNIGTLVVILRSQLNRVGVEVLTPIVPEAEWTEGRDAGEWEAVITSRVFPPDPGFTPLLACGGSENRTGFCDPELDGLLWAADRTLDETERRTALAGLQLAIAEAARALPLYYSTVPELVSERIGNFRGGGAHLGSLWNVWEWTLD